MANVAGVSETREDRRRTAPSARRAIPVSEARAAAPLQDRSSLGIHPRAFWLPMAAAAWFLISMAISFSDTLETGYLMAVVFVKTV